MGDADDEKPQLPRRSSLAGEKSKERKSKSAKFVDDEGAGGRRKSSKSKKDEIKEDDEDAFKKPRKSKDEEDEDDFKKPKKSKSEEDEDDFKKPKKSKSEEEEDDFKKPRSSKNEDDDDFKKPRKSKNEEGDDETGQEKRKSSAKRKSGDAAGEGDDESGRRRSSTKRKSGDAGGEGDDESGRRRSSTKRKSGDAGGEGASQRRRSSKRESLGGKRKISKEVDEEAKLLKDELEDKDTEGAEGEDKGEDKTQTRRRTLDDEEEKYRGHANEVGRAIDERDRQYRESAKYKVGEGWVIDKGKRLTRASLGLPPRKETTERKKKPKQQIQPLEEPEMHVEARPSAIKRMIRRERGEAEFVEAPAESPSTSVTSELKDIPIRPLFTPDEDVETMSVLQDAFTKYMFGAIEERLIKGDVKLPKSPTERSLTDVEKLLGLPPVDYEWEEMSGEGDDTLASPREMEDVMMTEKALLAQEAYRERAPMEKPRVKRKVRKLSEILHEIEDDFKKLYELVDEEEEGEEEEEEAGVGDEREKEEEGEWDQEARDIERFLLREQGRELVKTIQRYRGTGFGMNLGDILGLDSLRRYDGGTQDLTDEGLSKSEMDFLISALQQKLAEEKEQNERMLEIMRKRQFRVKQLYDAENMRFEARRSLMLHGDDEEEDLRMLWDYIDQAMIYFRKVERYM